MSEYLAILIKIIAVICILFGIVLAVGSAYAIDKEFRKCAGCHKIEEGKKGGMGPNLWGIYGSPAGQVEGYRYSKWLKESGIVWDRETKVITLMEILLKWITPKRDAAEMNNYRRSQQIHFDDLLK